MLKLNATIDSESVIIIERVPLMLLQSKNTYLSYAISFSWVYEHAVDPHVCKGLLQYDTCLI